MRKKPRRIGLAIVGAGRVGLFRGEVAARHPMVDFIGVADLKPERLGLLKEKTGADFVTTDFRELLQRKEVTAAIISTDEHLHVEPILAAVERGLSLLIEKPLATELSDSQRVLNEIRKSGVDAVVGYTQRFRRRWLAAKEKVRTGALGDVTLVTSRAFMNRLVALDNYKRTSDASKISPMVISGTHALDVVMWMMEAKRPVEIYARSVDKALGPLCGGIDATAGTIVFDDGALYHSVISWARCFEVLRMFTTAGDIALAMLRKVLASTGPLSGALFMGGAATVDWADEAGVRSSREAITMPTASEATMIKNE